MIVNFKQKTEGQHINMLFYGGIIAPYEIVEAWTEDMVNLDWCAIARFKYGGYDLINRVPPEFIVELRFHNPPSLFDGMIYLRKNGSLIKQLPVDKRDVKYMDGWIGRINELIKLAGNKILD